MVRSLLRRGFSRKLRAFMGLSLAGERLCQEHTAERGHAGDGLIAATAIEHEFVVVTRNVKDFGVCCLPIIHPWET